MHSSIHDDDVIGEIGKGEVPLATTVMELFSFQNMAGQIIKPPEYHTLSASNSPEA